MKIYQKLSLILSCTIFTFLAFAYLVSESYEKDFIYRAETELINEKINISNAVIESMKSNLEDSVKDWSYWDDLYYFVLKPYKQFISKNIIETALTNIRIHSLIIGNDQLEILSKITIDRENKLIETPEKFLTVIKNSFKELNTKDGVSDFFVHEKNVYIYHIRKVRPSDFKSKLESTGFIFMALMLNEDKIAKLKLLTNNDYKISFINSETNTVFTDDSVKINVFFQNNKQDDFFNFEFSVPRNLHTLIANHQKNSLVLILIFLPLAILFSYVFCFLFLKVPFDNFKNQIEKVMQADSDFLITHTTRDEFFEIETIVNNLKRINIENNKTKENERLIRVHKSRLESLGEMAAGMAHEINNPLAIIKGKSEILRKKIEPLEKPELINDLDKIISTTMRISKIINGLRTFARVSEEEEMSCSSLNEIIKDTLDMFSAKLKNDNINLIFNSDKDFLVNCRSIQIQQVLVNLINNSIYEIINKDPAWIKISIKELDNDIEIQFVDSGHSISDKISEKMMQPFFTTKPIGEGTGLGLSICYSIIKDHGGDLSFNPKEKNTTFIIKLPKFAPHKTI